MDAMSFDFSHLRIEESSPEGQIIQAIIESDSVTPEEALRRALRNPRSGAVLPQNAAQRMIGLFNQPENAALMDEVMELARESRQSHTTRDIGL